MVILLTVILSVTTCTTMDNQPTELKVYDEELIGVWLGEAHDEDGFFKKWTHIKYRNGNYVTAFKRFSTKGGELVEEFIAYGTWWVENGLLYQYEKDWMDKPIIYKYRMDGKGCIDYQLVSGDKGDDVEDNYRFTSCPSQH